MNQLKCKILFFLIRSTLKRLQLVSEKIFFVNKVSDLHMNAFGRHWASVGGSSSQVLTTRVIKDSWKTLQCGFWSWVRRLCPPLTPLNEKRSEQIVFINVEVISFNFMKITIHNYIYEQDWRITNLWTRFWSQIIRPGENAVAPSRAILLLYETSNNPFLTSTRSVNHLQTPSVWLIAFYFAGDHKGMQYFSGDLTQIEKT